MPPGIRDRQQGEHGLRTCRPASAGRRGGTGGSTRLQSITAWRWQVRRVVGRERARFLGRGEQRAQRRRVGWKLRQTGLKLPALRQQLQRLAASSACARCQSGHTRCLFACSAVGRRPRPRLASPSWATVTRGGGCQRRLRMRGHGGCGRSGRALRWAGSSRAWRSGEQQARGLCPASAGTARDRHRRPGRQPRSGWVCCLRQGSQRGGSPTGLNCLERAALSCTSTPPAARRRS